MGDHRLTVLFSVLTLFLLLVMSRYFPVELAVPLPGSNLEPVLLLEFASQPMHLQHIFGPSGDPLRADRIAGMNIGNAIDYPFMLAYGLLVASFFWGVAREFGQGRWRLFAWMAITASLADAIENAIIYRMVADFAAGSDVTGELAILPYPVWLKFGLLAAACGGGAIAFIGMRRWILAALCLTAPLLFVPVALDPFGSGGLATGMIAPAFAAMAIHALTRWHGIGPVSRLNQSKV